MERNEENEMLLPQTAEEYLKNIEIQEEIVGKRNKRIKDFICRETTPGA